MNRRKSKGEEMEVELDETGLKVFNTTESPLSGGKKRLQIDQQNWPNGRMEVEMHVKAIRPTLSAEDGKALDKLTLEITEIGKNSKSMSEFWDKVENELGIVKDEDTISLDENKSAKKNLISFVNFLVDNNMLEEKDIPVSIGYKRYLLNTKPRNKEEEEMDSPVKIDDNIYLETKFSTNQIKEKIFTLGKRFGKM